MPEPAAAPVEVPVPRAQQRVWLADQLTPNPAAYLSGCYVRLRGRLDVAALGRALSEIVARHEVLRTSIVERHGELVGLLRPSSVVRLEVTDARQDRLDATIAATGAEPLDIAAGPPMRARLLRISADDHVLCLVLHHIAHDGASVAILYRELGHRYATQTADQQEPPLAHQFRDIAAAEETKQDTGEFSPVLAERLVTLADRSPFEIPTDLPRPPVRSGRGDVCRGFDLPPATTRQLVALAREHASTLFMVLLAACHTVLYRHTGRGDVTTGTSSSTRRHDSDSTAVIGPFFNMVVVAGDVSGNPTFLDLLDRVRRAAMDAYESRVVPFDLLVTDLKVDRDPATTPLFQILVDLIGPGELPDMPGLRAERILQSGGGSKYDLTFEFHHGDSGLSGFAEWDTALYARNTVLRLLAHLRAVLVTVAERPSVRVDEIPILDADEVRALRSWAEPPPTTAPPDRCLHELIAEQTARTPDAVAVCDGATRLTYAELAQRSTTIARGLATLGVTTDVPVGVLIDCSADQVCAVIGILQAGGAYLPIDPETPPSRATAVLTAAGAPVCIVPTGTHVSAVGCHGVDVATLLDQGGASSCRSDLPSVSPANLCAVYFTSGSTGQPKGVACTHRGWVGQMANMQRQYPLRPGDTILLKTPLGFDDVARELFWPLMVGGRVVVLPPGLHRDPQALARSTIEHRAVWLQFVPSMLAEFVACLTPDDVAGLTHLRHVVSDGDRLRPQTVRTFLDLFGDYGCHLNNQWGATEVSIDTSHHSCGEADCADGDAVTLGRPMAGHTVQLLDHALQLVPQGAVGELCIGGVGLARGYLGRPGTTARVFVPDPWRPGERLYRTGDLGRLDSDGLLRYIGRRDHQVKVRGIRVELGEVEVAIRAFPEVTDVVVATWDAGPGDRRLVAYVTMAPEHRANAGPEESLRTRLRDFLVDRLPSAAVPGVIMPLPELPRMPSGKIDRRSLPTPNPETSDGEAYVPPTTDAETALVDIWREVLGLQRLGVNDNFFAAGGHSLLVTRVVNRMRAAFAIDVPIRLVFEHPTVRGTATELEHLILAEIEALTDAEAKRLLADGELSR